MPSLHLSQDIIDFFYPVGSYYETSNTSFDPNVKWGGTWVEDSAGRDTVAYDSTQTEFNSVGKTGGSKYIQDHWHAYRFGSSPGGDGSGLVYSSTIGTQNNKIAISDVKNVTTGNSGNLQPYVVVKRWHRTA